MLYAIVDIGSSIIKYKIYKKNQENIEPVIINDKTSGLISYRLDNKLTDKGIKVLIKTLTEFIDYSNKLNVDKNFFFATASLRDIENSEYVLLKVKKELNIDIRILSGEEEAKLSFESLKFVEKISKEGILVDIGGGSSEVSIFENDKAIEQKSLKIGVLTIYNKYVSLLYPTKKEQNKIIDVVTEKIKEQHFDKYEKEYLYGIGKTFVTIKTLFEHINIKKDKGNLLNINQVNYFLDKYAENTKENFKPLLQVDSERVHTIIPSLLIVKALSQEFSLKQIYVCNVTLQDGIILNIIEK